jgi:hypothetical protein
MIMGRKRMQSRDSFAARHRDALAPGAAGLVIGLLGMLGIVMGVPWLFPSLAPSIAIQATTPGQPSARPWNVFAGHMIGLGCGLAAVYLTGAAGTPSVTDAHALTAVRVSAAVLSVLLSMWLQGVLRARHPAAEATTLLIALGTLTPTLHTALTVTGGVTLVTALGEVTRRLLAGEDA